MKHTLRSILIRLHAALLAGAALWLAFLPVRSAARILSDDAPSRTTAYTYAWRASIDDPVLDGFGISYHGYAGAALALALAVTTLAALAALWLGDARWRLAGWIALSLVAALWAINIVRFAVIDPGYYGATAAIYAALLAIVLLWRLWRPARGRTLSAADAA